MLSSKGIDAITPLRLTITDPVIILVIIILALIFPPLSWLHIWLLRQAWRYAFPMGEGRHALQYAAVVTGIITLLAVGAIVFWLTNVQTDYYPVVGVMTLITVAISTGAAIRLGRERGFSDGFVIRLSVATALLSVIVPIGVASIWVAWPIIITLIMGFISFRSSLNYYLNRIKSKITQWQIDQLALGILIIFSMILVPIAWMTLRVVSIVAIPSNMHGIVGLGAVVVVLIVSVVAVRLYVGWRARTLIVKKNVAPGEAADDVRLFSGAAWWGPLFGGAFVWLVTSAFLSGLVFYLQAGARSWFQTLIIK